ncbi:MAG: cache domain-containing protein [Candidatus Omnitrophica bacterium]|nr:cache domain-containing protein [Candidatus Omnitrophota bacterium]MDD5311092.1 cache domain-containing protein [Candidatus Omnitrophota bacterium]MDD5546416.1 cache domain-containing protein [Candidatus Omnitrophota bacterium]
MKKKISIYGFILAFILTSAAQAAESDNSLDIILKLQDKIDSAFIKMDSGAAFAAREIQKTGASGNEGRKIIADLARSSPYAVDCSYIDAKGIMAIVEPEEYKSCEGSDVSGQEQVIRIQRTRRPVMSDAFKCVEGFYASDIEQPVFSARGDFAGSVSLLFKPEDLLSAVIKSVTNDPSLYIWVMQKDGRILYDPDPDQIGRMLFSDPLYEPFPDTVAFGRKIAADRTGSGSYNFYDLGTTKPVKKNAVWTTIALHGTEWRLVVATKEFSANDKQDAVIKNATQQAVSMLQAVYDRAQKDNMTLDQAKEAGANLLRSLRYGDDGKGYFWADTVAGVNVVLYGDKKVEGKNRLDANINGVNYIREIITRGKQPGGGYTDYWFPKPGSSEPSKKRGYSLLFRPFGWVVGTGYYPD